LAEPIKLLMFVPLLALLVWSQRRTLHPMSPGRKKALLAVRCAVVLLVLLAMAGPAWETRTSEESVIFLVDHSRSLGSEGMKRTYRIVGELAAGLPRSTRTGLVSAGESPVVRRLPSRGPMELEPDEKLIETGGAQSDLASAVSLASGLFPPGTARRLVLLTDGIETRGDLGSAARDVAISDVVIDALPVAGEVRPDVRVVKLTSSRQRLHEGATVKLEAHFESSLTGKGVVRLFENGVEVVRRELELEIGKQKTMEFHRTPDRPSLYSYRVRVEGFDDDTIPENNEAIAFVDVKGRPLMLYVEGDPDDAHYLAGAMEKEGIRLQVRPPESIPESLQELAGYDALILSDVPAHRLSERAMALMRDYVEHLAGGFVMIGGMNSFGVGGYYRTPIENILPVKMKGPDIEERHTVALAMVIDRSGSMQGQKIEICKSAAIATVELLSKKDYVGVVAFDSAATWIVPVTRVSSRGSIVGNISTLNAGGGTNIYPGMMEAGAALEGVKAASKHMTVLSDGQTSGSGYQALAAQIHAKGITISTVAVGGGADMALLQSIAASGGGKFYATADPANIPRIFTQDAMIHAGRLIREEAFQPKQVEKHPMLESWNGGEAPALLGYVKTRPKKTAQIPLVTDLGDPLLAHWRFGLGKVTAFTSDCKSRWSPLWITGWQGYSQFWAQVLRETAREPQGQNMDIQIRDSGEEAKIRVDLLQDAATFKNEARVDADVYFVAANALGSGMKPVANMVLDQQGPGRYEGEFSPRKPGVYLVRARSGADMVSGGLVHNVSNESATGLTNDRLLEKVCRTTGGSVLSAGTPLSRDRVSHARFVDLVPMILRVILLLFLVDLGIRRWENVLGVVERITGIFGR